MNAVATQIQREITSAGALAPLASIALMMLHSLVPFFPSEIVTAANGLVFGPALGVVLSWVGAMLGGVLGYAIGLFGGRPLFRRLVPARHLALVSRFVDGYGSGGLLVLRLIPVVSFNLINYAAGLAGVGWWVFLWTTAVGMVPGTILIVLAASGLGRGDLRALWFLAALVALIAAGLYLRRRLKGKEHTAE